MRDMSRAYIQHQLPYCFHSSGNNTVNRQMYGHDGRHDINPREFEDNTAFPGCVTVSCVVCPS